MFVLQVLCDVMYTHPFNGLFSRTTWYQKGKTNLDFSEARDSEWQWHQLGICKSAPRSRQITTPAPHHFLQAGCPSCRPTNSVKALKAKRKKGKTSRDLNETRDNHTNTSSLNSCRPYALSDAQPTVSKH